jgi:excisionase family DNA binding protein
MKTTKEQENPIRRRLLNVRQAAIYINCSKTWLYNSVANYKLPFPCFRTEYGIRFDTADLDDYLSKREILPVSPGKNKREVMRM